MRQKFLHYFLTWLISISYTLFRGECAEKKLQEPNDDWESLNPFGGGLFDGGQFGAGWASMDPFGSGLTDVFKNGEPQPYDPDPFRSGGGHIKDPPIFTGNPPGHIPEPMPDGNSGRGTPWSQWKKLGK